MIYNKFFSYIIFLASLLNMSLFAMEPTQEDDSAYRKYRLKAQIKLVKKQVNFAEKDAVLVLGVDNGERNINERFKEYKNIVFVSSEHYNEECPRSLSLDFNELNELSIVARRLEGSFDRIILDDSTFKFSRWTLKHINLFKKLLRDGGEFIFGPAIDMSTRNKINKNFDYTKPENTFFEVSSRILSDFEDELATIYFIGHQDYEKFINADEYTQEISRAKNIYKFIYESDFSLSDKQKFLRKENIFSDPNLFNLKQLSGEQLNEYALFSALRNIFEDKIFTLIVKHNWVNICQLAFGANNVSIDHNKPLPFKSNFQETQRVLITARK